MLVGFERFLRSVYAGEKLEIKGVVVMYVSIMRWEVHSVSTTKMHVDGASAVRSRRGA